MAITVGQQVPDFTLHDLDGKPYSLSQYKGRIVVLLFWAATCDVTQRYTAYLNSFYETYKPRGVVVLGIDSHAWDTPERIRWVLEERQIEFPLLRDADGKVADLFGVTVTPTVCVIDREGVLRYWGAIDDRTHDKPWPDIIYLENAVDALLLGQEVDDPQNEPWGCPIERA